MLHSCVQPGMQYFNEWLHDSMQIPLAAFKAARLFSPLKVQEMQRNNAAVDCLSAFPFLDCNTGNLKSELPQYIAAVEDVNLIALWSSGNS